MFASIGDFAGVIGVFTLIALAIGFSADRQRIRPMVVVRALGLQILIGFFALKLPVGQVILGAFAERVLALINYTQAGVGMVFGALVPTDGRVSFFVQVLPIIVFFSALMSVLYHLQIMRYVVEGGGWVLRRLVGLRPLESLNAVANIFIGQAEAPLTLRPLLRRATDAQIFAITVSGMASVSGTVLAAYTNMGISIDYLIAASCMAAPGGLLMGHLFYPETRSDAELAELDKAGKAAKPTSPANPSSQLNADIEEANSAPPADDDFGGAGTEPDENNRYENVIMAAAMGAEKGLVLAAKVGAMLLAFVALIALANGILGAVGGWVGIENLTIQRGLGYIFSPVMLAVGTAPGEAIAAGGIFGEKLVTNEFVAYYSLSEVIDTFSDKTGLILTFALCGFANVSSIAIVIGGLGSLVPAHRNTIARLGIRAVIAASFSNLMSAALAGLIFSI